MAVCLGYGLFCLCSRVISIQLHVYPNINSHASCTSLLFSSAGNKHHTVPPTSTYSMLRIHVMIERDALKKYVKTIGRDR